MEWLCVQIFFDGLCFHTSAWSRSDQDFDPGELAHSEFTSASYRITFSATSLRLACVGSLAHDAISSGAPELLNLGRARCPHRAARDLPTTADAFERVPGALR